MGWGLVEPRDAMDSRASSWVMAARGPRAIDRDRSTGIDARAAERLYSRYENRRFDP